MASVYFMNGPCRGRHFGLGRGSVMFGRDLCCQISICDEQVSRRHLQILYDREAATHRALDVGSANGVLINGARLERGTPRSLVDGDEIRIGQSTIRYLSRHLAAE